MGLKKGRRFDPKLDTMVAYARYQELGSLTNVAKETGFSVATIRYRFKKAGLPIYKPGKGQDQGFNIKIGRPAVEFDLGAAYADYLQAGLTLVAKKHGVSTTTLLRRFREANLKIFKPGRRLQGDAPIPGNIRQQRFQQKKKFQHLE